MVTASRRGRRGAAVAAGLLADRLLGEPPIRPHPLSVFGSLMRSLESRVWHDSRPAGVLHACTGVALGTTAGAVVRSDAVGVYASAGGNALASAARRVESRVACGDLEGARLDLPSLVGRDVATLDEKAVVRAVVESVAENTVDAVVAPALWGLLWGSRGALAYRAANTLDAMVGRRDERYARFGWASARLDDVCSWAPARLTAVLVALVRPSRAAAIWRAAREDAPAHPSPNAGVAEACFAAALGLRLGGANTYGGRLELRPTLGDGRAPELPDIGRALRLSRDVTVALALLTCLPATLELGRAMLTSRSGGTGRQ